MIQPLPAGLSQTTLRNFGSSSIRQRVKEMGSMRMSPSEWVQSMVMIPKAGAMEQLESGEGAVNIGDDFDALEFSKAYSSEGEGILGDIEPTNIGGQGLASFESTLERFSLEGQPYMPRCYNSGSRRRLYVCARQVAKSTLGGNTLLAYSCLKPNFRSIFVSPSEAQTKRFSMFRIADPIRYSKELQVYKGSSGLAKAGQHYTDNVFSKRFTTGSTMTLGYALLSADRLRGLSGDLLFYDEIQDLLAELIPVIRESLFTSPYKMEIMAGTPKSLDNTANYYWEQSTQNEWIVKCGGCGKFNVLGVKNIGKTGPICASCGHDLHPHDTSMAQWASVRDPQWLKETNPLTRFDGYRIPQLISPFVSWPDILYKLEHYPTAEFMNEVLGKSHDSATKLLTKDQLVAISDPSSPMDVYKKWIGRGPTFMGVDWGTGENGTSFTVVSILAIIGGKLRYVYYRRFLAHESQDAKKLAAEIGRLVHVFNVQLVGADYGGGQDKIFALGEVIGHHKILAYQYCNTKLVSYDGNLNRYLVNRTETIMRFVNMIYRGVEIVIPKYESVAEPFMGDLRAVFREMDSMKIRAKIQKSPGASDDTLHSMLYAALVSLVMFPRPSFLTPDMPVH